MTGLNRTLIASQPIPADLMAAMNEVRRVALNPSITLPSEFSRVGVGQNNCVLRWGDGHDDLCLKAFIPGVHDPLDRAEREWRAMSLLSGQSVVATPAPVAFDPSSVPVLAMSFLGGHSLGDKALSPEQLVALTGTLRALFDLRPQASTHHHPARMTTPRQMVARVSHAYGEGPPQLSNQMLRLWRHWQRGPALKQLEEAPSTVCFGRGDPNLANCLWDGSRLALIDLEYSGWSDPAYELADLIEHPRSRGTDDSIWDDLVTSLALDDETLQRFDSSRCLLSWFWLMRARAPHLSPAVQQMRVERLVSH